MRVVVLGHKPAVGLDLVAQGLVGGLDVLTRVVANFRREQPAETDKTDGT